MSPIYLRIEFRLRFQITESQVDSLRHRLHFQQPGSKKLPGQAGSDNWVSVRWAAIYFFMTVN